MDRVRVPVEIHNREDRCSPRTTDRDTKTIDGDLKQSIVNRKDLAWPKGRLTTAVYSGSRKATPNGDTTVYPIAVKSSCTIGPGIALFAEPDARPEGRQC